ncbi:MAG TPA: DUF4271 domain-containing protein [Saprospiraceae bacterium]|nr:DUF4271 domain-containing protein [Saprospiraceae bacterium]
MKMVVYFSLLFILFLTPKTIFAQAESNPFELKQRIKEQPKKADTLIETGPINPFDIDRDGSIPRDEHVFNDPDLLKKGWKVDGFTFWIFVLLLFLLAILMPFGRHTIFSFYRGLTGAGPFNILFRNYGTLFSPVGIGLSIFFLLNAGLFGFLVGKQYGWLTSGSFQDWILITGSLALFILLKQLAVSFLGWVFPMEKDVNKYRFLIGVFNGILGLFLFPVNWLLAYGPENIREPLIYVTVGVTILFYLYRYLMGISSASQQVLRNKFNFFMYLCTLEIAPLLVIVKYVLFYREGEFLQ